MSKKRTLKKFVALTMSLLTILSTGAPAFAEGSKDIDYKVQDFIINAKNVYLEEMDKAVGLQDDIPQAFLYQYADEKYIYTYENLDGEEGISVSEIESEVKPFALLPGGIGGRQYIKANGKVLG